MASVGTAFVIVVLEPKTALLLTAAHNIRFVMGIMRFASPG
jgi:hypothetical protein